MVVYSPQETCWHQEVQPDLHSHTCWSGWGMLECCVVLLACYTHAELVHATGLPQQSTCRGPAGLPGSAPCPSSVSIAQAPAVDATHAVGCKQDMIAHSTAEGNGQQVMNAGSPGRRWGSGRQSSSCWAVRCCAAALLSRKGRARYTIAISPVQNMRARSLGTKDQLC